MSASTETRLAVVIQDFSAFRSGTLRGFARVALPWGMILADVGLHVAADGRAWASAPCRAMVDRDGHALRDAGGQIRNLDYRHGAAAWEDANRSRLPETRTHQTVNGGRHALFRYAPGVRNSAGRIAPGVDVRGDGGYVIFPPSPGYSVISDAPITAWPDWLLQPGLVLPAPPQRPIDSEGAYTGADDRRLDAYRVKLLANVSAAGEGAKHVALRNTGLALGGIAAEAGFSDLEAVEWLMAALPATVQDWNAARRTAAWAVAEGRENPIKLPDRPRSSAPRTPRPASPSAPLPDAAHSAPNKANGQAHSNSTFNKDSTTEPGGHVGQRRSPDDAAFAWPEPLDVFADPNSEAPELRHDHIPAAINGFAFDTAARMGVDPTSVALCAITACASVVSDEWKVQPKRLDQEWTESPRMWMFIVGPPSTLKSPVMTACTRPIDKLDEAARRSHAEEMRAYKKDMKAAKADPTGQTPEPRHPKLARYLVEGATLEALTEVLRNDDDAHQHAPAGKVLSRQDELTEFVANFDRYQAGGKGGGDRGAYLRTYNGGRYVYDRIGRGSFAIPNWSICLMGGIQPGPIQKIARGAAADGLLQRPLYCVPGPQAPIAHVTSLSA